MAKTALLPRGCAREQNISVREAECAVGHADAYP